MSKKRVEVWSCGGGTQSIATGVLIVQGVLPKPDHALIVDTTRESSDTWDYMDNHLAPMMAKHGVEIHRINCADYGARYLDPTVEVPLPMFTAPDGRLRGFCSGSWKRDPARKYLNEVFPKSKFTQWIGYSVDEIRRLKVTEGKWQNWYPLIDLRLSRFDCISLVEKHGLPSPPRSSCWCCPNRSDYEWEHMKNKNPVDFQKAEDLERFIQESGAVDAGDDVYLHRSNKRLGEARFSGNNGDLFCDSGAGCFT